MDKKIILIIDDDRNNIKSTKDFLEKAGFEVISAESGAQGLEKLRQRTPELILLDLVLPDESGFKIAHQIKNTPEYAQIPIMAISLKTEDVDKHIAAKSGIIGYFEKPINYKKLLYAIKDILG